MRDQKISGSVRAAVRGVAFTFMHERNFRIEIFFAFVVFCFLIFAQAALWQWFAAITMIVIVLAAELVNTALERVVDILKPQKHPYARVIKDIAAGMVLVIVVGVGLAGAIVLVPLIDDFLGTFLI